MIEAQKNVWSISSWRGLNQIYSWSKNLKKLSHRTESVGSHFSYLCFGLNWIISNLPCFKLNAKV